MPAYFDWTHVCFYSASFDTVKDPAAHDVKQDHRLRCACDVLFGSQKALKDHRESCDHCSHKSPEHLALRGRSSEELSHPGLDYCPYCSKDKFRTAVALEDHTAFGHEGQLNYPAFEFRDYYCRTCSSSFEKEKDFRRRARDDGHELNCLYRSGKKMRDFYGHKSAEALARLEELMRCCEQCNSGVVNNVAWRKHKASLRHRPLSNLKCPLSKSCYGTFTAPSKLIQRLEWTSADRSRSVG